MPDPEEITEATRDHLERYVLEHIRETHEVAREVQDLDAYNGPLVFGVTYYQNLRRRIMDAVVPPESTPFCRVKISKGYYVPAIDHARLGLIALHHHRVKPPTYLPNPNAAQALRERAVKGKDLFGEKSREVADRLVGIVADPLGELKEVVVGKMVPAYPDGYRVSHKRKLDLDGGLGTDQGGDDGGPSVGPEPEPDVEPTVTREKPKKATSG
jgi:hypothetical protein